MKPLLAHIYEPHRVTYPCYVQPKLNGIRALYQNGHFQSRDELPFPEELLAHLSGPLLEAFGSKHPPLDGELYVHGWPLQRILAAVTPVRGQPTEDTTLVEYHVFDTIDFAKPFIERQSWLQTPIGYLRKDRAKLALVFTTRAQNEYNANYFYIEAVEDGYEGIMYRLGDCPYTTPKQQAYERQGERWQLRSRFLSDKNNRCWHLLKRKDWQDDEFEFVSIERTVGALGEPGFQLWCKAKNGRPFKFGSGLTQAEVTHYIENPPLDRLVKGKYLTLSVDGIPQNGTILAIL